MEKKSDKKRLEDIPVVKEFLDVFPEDLPGLPPIRQVEFQIDLIPGAALVARTPYRLAPSEMQELSNQLQRLLTDRGLFDQDFMLTPVHELKQLRTGRLPLYPQKSLSRKDENKSYDSRVRALIITVHPKLPSQILEAQNEALKEENIKAENLRGMDKSFKIGPDGTFKAECQKPSGLLVQTKIPMWKWERIIMDFVTKLPKTSNGHDTIWVIIDHLTKYGHFIPTRATDSMETLTRSPVCWAEVGDVQFTGPEIIHETTEKIMQIRQRLQAARDRQRSIFRFGKRGKLNPRYIGPFKILEWIGPAAYKLELLEELSNIHNTFHVSNLKKCLSNESLINTIKELQLDDKLNFVEEPVEIIDHEIKQLKRSHIPIVKV
ncbi:reverse transcriptase domain-containing protein [Tanacetum coccineum]